MKWYDPLKATGPFGWVSWLISAFNKNDKTFSKIGDGLGSIFNKYTGAGPTGADVYANTFSAEEAQKARDWEEEMSNTAFQRQVVDMQKAGLNPALMYGGVGSAGASTPSSPSPSSVVPQSQGIVVEKFKTSISSTSSNKTIYKFAFINRLVSNTLQLGFRKVKNRVIIPLTRITSTIRCIRRNAHNNHKNTTFRSSKIAKMSTTESLTICKFTTNRSKRVRRANCSLRTFI